MTVFSQLPVEISSVKITGISSLFRIIFIGIIIYLTDFITTVDYRDTGLGEHECMQCDVITDGSVHSFLISFESKALNTTERSCCSAEPCITKTWVIVIKLASCERIRIFSCKEVVQIFLMRYFLNTEVFKIFIIQSPSDIVVAAEIILKYIISRKFGDDIQLTAKQRDIFRCNCVPRACHSRNVVQQMTFWFFNSSEVWNNLFRSHDNFSEKKNARAYDLADHTHDTDDGVNLWQVTAVSAKLFPNVRYSVQTDDIYPLVSQVQHVKDHFVQDDRVTVVQIPLIWIEGSHNMFMKVFQPCEVTRCSGREYFRTGLLI